MNKQERNIVIGGVLITALAAGGFSLSQGSTVSADDNYKTPTNQVIETETVETKIATEEDVSKTEEVKNEEEIETSNKEVKEIVNEEEKEDIKTDYDTYSFNKEYEKGDIVIYSGKEYKAKWWNKGTNPSDCVDWEEVVSKNSDGSINYAKGKHYLAGDVVVYEGVKYKANHWTKSTPGIDSSWSMVN
ncbi:MAG: carbohydrate-binding protein [Peptostreptococcaceae bacterium]